MNHFAGLVALASTIDVTVVSRNNSQVPTDADAAPTYRIYGPAGFMVSGSLTFKDNGTITGATNASPTVITSLGHGLTTGTKVTISGILGNTGANGTYDVTVLTSNTFSIAIDTSLGSPYTSGGVWHSTGLYRFSFTPTTGANFGSGIGYSVVIFGKFSTVVQVVDSFVFQVT